MQQIGLDVRRTDVLAKCLCDLLRNEAAEILDGRAAAS